MNKTYCFSCGGAVLYKLEKPNFCNNCGSALSGKQQKLNAKTVSRDDLDEDLEDDIYWSKEQFSQDALDVEINIRKDAETLGQMGQVDYSESGGLNPLGQRDMGNLSAEESMQQFKKEAGFKGAKKKKGKRSKAKGRGRPKKKT
jgi:hypothetical protein